MELESTADIKRLATISDEKQIISIWDKYVLDNKIVIDNRGNDLGDIDQKRVEAIEIIKIIISDFLSGKIDVSEFKTDVDSYNKQNNLWGFTSIKGQMFFNLLLKNNDSKDQLKTVTKILKETITEPGNIAEALEKIEILEMFCTEIFSQAIDKRKAPNPGSVGYFLSYFWQISNFKKWPVMYSSIIVALSEIGLWDEQRTQVDAYNYFFKLNEEIKQILSVHTGKKITNWDIEHSFWNFKKVTAYPKNGKQKVGSVTITVTNIDKLIAKPNFEVTDYIIPKLANLVELSQGDQSSAAKGNEFEKLVAEAFRQMDFDVEILGQGSGRNPDAIIKFREENVAFLIDAKAYSNGYSLGVDDRAIKEYINHYCPKLKTDGYKKIGFIIVSNSFKSNFDSFINNVTWDTDIKRFILLTSEALLFLLAYKTKDKLSLSSIIEKLVGLGNIVTPQDIVEEFADV